MSIIPFHDRDGHIWYDGQLVPWRDAKVHVLTHGLHYGSCVFEGERIYNGSIFKSREHSVRLKKSAELLGFDIPYSVDEIEEAKVATCKAANMVNGYIRPVAWRGSEMMGVSAQHNKIHLAIACWEWPSYFTPEARMKGIHLQLSKWRRPAPDTAPTEAKAAGLYMICTMSKHAAEKDGFQDALMLDYRGYVAEATGANFFMIKDGVIHTPMPDCFLNGITRQTVIDLAKRRGYQVIERHIQLEEVQGASEIFLTGTAAEVTPVGRIGDWTFTPGEVCRNLMLDYDALVNGRLEAAAAE
ncbi:MULTISPECIES: branched-chain amino acid aminotransferase [unclassified Azospirillum]|jgi:branched-chain amino acid aminotransferase|uniref:branched-chain amino acid aminotransferase n=1 Tax=unclassified Azospirillum TaxID=2630922 RepID=UPI000B71B4C2|nr:MULTISPECIES: branched-chain amino acid aminotransferase [unclassified Azospirillum]SNS77479.1 branched chain amino acid aminotransferase apoenzyme [Azospirillum sp. RU38E]SNS94638.1 branched chain amino acid aminotransferase apoenzyme [Azospirillum sp. RU37A]